MFDRSSGIFVELAKNGKHTTSISKSEYQKSAENSNGSDFEDFIESRMNVIKKTNEQNEELAEAQVQRTQRSIRFSEKKEPSPATDSQTKANSKRSGKKTKLKKEESYRRQIHNLKVEMEMKDKELESMKDKLRKIEEERKLERFKYEMMKSRLSKKITECKELRKTTATQKQQLHH